MKDKQMYTHTYLFIYFPLDILRYGLKIVGPNVVNKIKRQKNHHHHQIVVFMTNQYRPMKLHYQQHQPH